MTFIRKKTINGRTYLYEQKSVRIGDTVKSVHVRYIGSGSNTNNVVPNDNIKNSNDDNDQKNSDDRVLFIDEKGEPHTQKDYVDFYLDNNKLKDNVIKGLKKGNKKVLGNIPKEVWVRALKRRKM